MAADSSRCHRLAAWRRVLVAALAAALVGPAATASRIRAADGPDVLVLPGRTLAVVPADIDGHGRPGLMRIVESGSDGLDLEAWAIDDDGLTVTGTSRLISDEGSVAALLPWRQNGRVRVLALTAVFDQDGSNECCFRATLVIPASNGNFALQPLDVAGSETVDIVYPLDMDADGTDELVAQSVSYAGLDDNAAFEATYHVTVRAWDGSRFKPVHESVSGWSLAAVGGDSDGVPGDDVILTDDAGSAYEWLAMVGGAVTVEEAERGTSDGWPIGITEGRILLQTASSLSAYRWPRGGEPARTASVASDEQTSTWIAGSGDGAIVVAAGWRLADRSGRPAATIYDLDLKPLGEVRSPQAVRELARVAQRVFDVFGQWHPLIGSLATEKDGTAAAVSVAGVLITPGGPARYTATPFSPLVGRNPIAVAGPDDDWLVASEGVDGPYGGPGAFLFPQWETSDPLAFRVSLLRLSALRGFEAESGAIGVELDGAIERWSVGQQRRIVAGPGGFVATIVAPAGSNAVIGGPTVPDETALVGDGALKLSVRASHRDHDVPFERWLMVVLPDGRYVLEDWSGVFVGGEMHVEVDASTHVFALSVTLSGKTTPGAVVSAGSRSATADAAGVFELRIGAAPWPASVQVTATDPFDRTASTSIEVIGFVDYRGLPWALILGALGVLAAVALYIRPPRHTPEAPPDAEAGILEEVGD